MVYEMHLQVFTYMISVSTILLRVYSCEQSEIFLKRLDAIALSYVLDNLYFCCAPIKKHKTNSWLVLDHKSTLA